MIRPRTMKHVQMTVLKSDVNAVIAYLGRNELMHFGDSDAHAESEDSARIKALLEKLRAAAEFVGVDLPPEPDVDSALPAASDEALARELCAAVDTARTKEAAVRQEKQRIEEALNEARAFANLNAPFADLDQLSYLTLRVGRLDPKMYGELKERLAGRAAIIPLGGEGEGRVLAASSRKGRFALDSELKNHAFEPITIPEGYQGVPAELLEGLEARLGNIVNELNNINDEKAQIRDGNRIQMRRLASLLLMAFATEELKSRLVSTSSIYLLSGWVPADSISKITAGLAGISGGRTAIRMYTPDEIPEVRNGGEKVPVALKHGNFVKSFEGVVASYGTPLYGSIDPTPLVAVFFTLLFGIMFGDLGQGFVLFAAGILTGKYGPRALAKFGKFSTPLVAVGISSMVMGFLTGEIFTSEHLLVTPTRAITAALGHPVDRVLTIMPLAEKGGSVTKLFYFFGFTIAIGVILNSLGLIINIINRYAMKKYEAAFFAKTGLAGLLLFWYAVFIAARCIAGGRFERFDFAGLLIPAVVIFFGPVLWRCIAREKPILEHGLMTFAMEGFVEIMETASSYISNTVSFLRVGAFALSHAVLSYIVFRFTEEIAHAAGGPFGVIPAAIILLFGNIIIIVLEGMIVAIQVVRLQYYEFFSKFFTETGIPFAPFRFRKNGAEK